MPSRRRSSGSGARRARRHAPPSARARPWGRRRPRRGRGGTAPRRRRRGDRGGWGRRSHPSPRAACVRLLRGGRARGGPGQCASSSAGWAVASAAASPGLPRRGSGGAYFWAVPRKDQVTPSRNANATSAMTPNSHGGIGSSRAVGSSSLRKRATVIDMRASLAPRLSTEVVHSPVHGRGTRAHGLWTTTPGPEIPPDNCSGALARHGISALERSSRLHGSAPTREVVGTATGAGRTDNGTDLARLAGTDVAASQGAVTSARRRGCRGQAT